MVLTPATHDREVSILQDASDGTDAAVADFSIVYFAHRRDLRGRPRQECLVCQQQSVIVAIARTPAATAFRTPDARLPLSARLQHRSQQIGRAHV